MSKRGSLKIKHFLILGGMILWTPLFAQNNPEILNISPARYSMQNSPTVDISVLFDQDMNGGTFLPQNFLVYGNRTGFHSGTLTYNATTQTATFEPATPFQAGEMVNVVLTQGIRSSSDVPLASSFQWSFFIRATIGTAGFSLDADYATGEGPHFVGIGDLNNDFSLDIAVPHSRSDEALTWLNQGGGIFSQNTTTDVGRSPRALTIGDFENDDDLDIAVANEVENSVLILDNDGTGNFSARDTTFAVGTETEHVTNADLNGDGFLDLVTANNDSNAISVLLNQGDGNFQDAVSYPVGLGPQASFIADFDNDGLLDIAVANSDDGSVSVLLNDGTGGFGAAQDFTVGAGPRAIEGHDFNLDGLLDLAVANRTDNTITILFNLGSANFSLPNNFSVGQDPFAFSAADLQGDLDPDLVVSNRLSNDFYVLLNNGSGFFEVDSIYATGPQPRGLNTGDFNGDGVLDVGVVNWETDNLQVFFNELREVQNQAPGAPSLVSPGDLAFLNPDAGQVVFNWNVPVDPEGDLLHFKLEISQDPTFAAPILTFDSSNDASGFSPTPPVDQSTTLVAFNLSTALQDGPYWWRVSAFDGQTSGPPSQSRKLTLDSTSPVISDIVITDPAFPPNWYNQSLTTSIDFGGVYDESHADKARFDLRTLGGIREVENISSGSDQIVQMPVDLSGAADGAVTLSVTVFDSAGNQATRNRTIALDGSAPTDTRASSPATTNEETFTVSWDGTGTDGVGSGLSGFYDVRLQVNGGPWTPWLTNFQGTSAQFTGEDGSTYGFEVGAHDNVGNLEAFQEMAESVTAVDTNNDVTAPGPPLSLTANGANPSPWQNTPLFQISWQEPADPSGIDRALYKLGAAPVSNFDTTGSVRGATSLSISATQENGQNFHLWFSDLSGNVNSQNNQAVVLRYDVTPPSGTLGSSPTTSDEETFEVSWESSGTDGDGSGLSGVYDVQVQVNGGAWTPWLTDFQGTSANYEGTHGDTYGFEVAAHDVAGNVESLLDVAETQTVVDTNANDTDAPGPPPVLTAGGSNPSAWQNSPDFEISWQPPSDPSGIARAFYKLGSAPTANSDTTGSVSSGTSLNISVTEEDGQGFHLWFEDARGNVDFRNHSAVLLRYDGTLPDVAEIVFLDADFEPNWYDQGSSGVAEVEINYDENHLQRIELESTDLDTRITVDSPPSGTDLFFQFDLDIEGESDGIYGLFFTLIDSAGNVQVESTELALDDTPPSGTTANSPDTTENTSFLVSWSGATDGDGSGLSGEFNVRFQEDGGPWQDWLTEFDGNSELFVGEIGKTYGFESAAIDNLENEEPFNEIAESVTVVDTSFSDATPPSVFHTQPLVVEQGQDVTIDARVEDNSQIAEVLLFYKQSGEVSFQSMPMTNVNGNDFEATLTADQISTMGINYFIRASDGRNFSFHPISNPDVTPNNLSVRILGTENEGLRRDEAQPAGDFQLFYRMISVPLKLEDEDPLAVLEDDLGSYDRKKWRLFQYDSATDSYSEYPEVDPLSPGTALWLIVRELNKFIDTGLGTTVVTNQPFEIILDQGWNDIAIPFQFAVNWSDVQVVLGSADDIMGPYHFEDEWQTPDEVTTLLPWEGYAIFSQTPGVKIAILPVSSRSTSKANMAKDWQLHIEALCRQRQNSSTALGVATDASTQWDGLDYLEPPHISDYVSVRFPHDDWQKFPGAFVTDFRPPSEEGHTWHFEVATSIENAPVKLNFKNLESIPTNFDIMLYDNAIRQEVDIRQNPEYVFRPNQNSLKRAFDLIIGTGEYIRSSDEILNSVPDAYFLSQNFPNPFNAGTTLTYQISAQNKVEIKVFNILGQQVKNLLSEEKEPGTYRIQWDGTGVNGRDVSSGVYMIKFEVGDFRQIRKVILVR
ncbi:T9SS type A sorting domain-containing protein [candidate division KSB1 bacterium]|nr:T9SS type A sorting domain-containing protein [candidate division KSB1 bacterium]NIR70582.1 T9SS type A sorting domain-containing protein [candidate division KSB1 bacterium]NIS27718.1 T9SS type A sorting domain-containing protein [candidate division KSB1 bacterium]NIT74546.1 T9SS type A sorting domain-containing protein [candidate division KSB1 bacterium]NIU28371.1 T9SS type A sorting domain-containing protein [candidate division KSB1 bacterium]